MKKCSKISMRVQSVVLVVAMLLSAVSPVLLFNAFAADDPKTPVNKSDAEIIVENYELSSGEEKVILSGTLVGNVHQYTKPEAKDELISVDIDSKKITVKTYEKESGYLWVPVSAQLVFEDTILETVTLSKNGSQYEGTYAYAEKAFSVKVVYEMALSIDEATQKLILAAPNALKQGVDNLDAIADADSKLGIILLAMDVLEAMASAEGYKVGAVSANFNPTGDAIAATNALAAQVNANDKFNLSSIAVAYSESASSVQYLVENGANAKAELKKTYDYIYAIRNDIGKGGDGTSTIWDTIIGLGGLVGADVSAVKALRTAMDEWLAIAETALEGDWSATDTQYLKAGLTEAQYLALDGLVDAVAENKAKDVALKNPLVADSTTLQYNMSMSDVNVTVALKVANGVIGSLELEEFGSKSVKITLADGATKAEIQAAIDATGILADTIASWGDKYSAEHYEAKYNVTLPDELTDDVNYVITYEPKTYTVTFDYQASINVPYGYRYLLPASEDVEKAYDYTVNGAAYAEKSVYTVVGDADITRVLGKAYVKSTLNQVVADCYFGSDAKAEGILTSGVFTVGNDPVNVRFPEQADGLVKITGMKLTAEKYAASYNGLVWVPYTYTVVNGAASATHDFNGATEVTITETEYDYVKVQYRLTLTNIDAALVNLLANLPDTLEKEAAAQKAVLDRLAGYESDMSGITKQIFDALGGMINGGDFSQEVKDSLSEAVNGVKNDCFDANGKLKIYNMIALYNDPNNGGLRYYYLNSAAVINEINLLSTYLVALLDTDEEIDALTVLLTNMQYGQYVEKLDKLSGAMESIANDLTAPNAYIDLKSENLGKFVNALLASGDAKAYPDAGELYMVSADDIRVNASNKYTVSVSVKTEGGKPISIPAKSFIKGYTLTSIEVMEIIQAVDVAIAQLGASDYFYSTNYNSADLMSLVGKPIESDVSLSYVWTLKEFTVSVEGTEDQKIDEGNREIKLPASPDSAWRYDYVVDGIVVSSGIYTFTTEQMERLFENQSYSIKRLEVDVARENLINLVDSLNDRIGDGSIVFALTEQDGKYSLVMKLNLENMKGLMGGMQGAIMGLVSSGYDYVGMGGEKFIYSDAELGLRVSLQTVVDAIMNSGFGTDTLIDVVDKDGNINHIALPGALISALPVAQAGGLLVETTMEFGNEGATPIVLPLYITAGSVSDQILKVRNLVAGEVGNYVSASCNNGVAGVQLTMPQKAYEAYLAALLATKQIDITDINAVNSEIAIGFAQDLLAPVFAEGVTVDTLANTLSKLGYKLNLDSYASIYNQLTKIYRGLEFTYDENGASAAGTVQIKALIDAMDLGELGKMIAEYETGVSFEIALSIANLGTEYDALYVDIRADGIVNKVGLVQKGKLPAKVASLAGASVIVLLSDVEGDLVFDTTTVLDLNGFKVTGDIVANGSVRIIDTAIDEDRCGTVVGTVSGNLTLAGGHYDADVSAFVKAGYAQNADGVVGNDFYSIVEDTDGNLTLSLNAGLLTTDAMPDVTTLLVNVAADLLMNGYTTNQLYVEGFKVYDITVEDFVDLYSGDNKLHVLLEKVTEMVDSEALAGLINTIAEDVTDFGALADAIENNAPILSYNLTVGSWNAELEHVEDGDYLTANLIADQVTEKLLNVVVTGEQADVDVVVGILRTLAGTTDVEVEVKGTHGFSSTDNKNLVLDWSAAGTVVIDFSDPKYAVALSIALADGLGATASADLVEAIKIYYEKDDLSSLKVAFHALKTDDVIAAVKAFTRDDDFGAMVENLGLSAVIGADVTEVEGYFDAIAKVAAAVLRRLPVTGSDRTLGSYLNPDGTYTFARENVLRERTFNIAKGYTATVRVEVVNVFFSLKLFGEIELDYTELEEQIAAAEALDGSKYTPDTWAALQAALEAAKVALETAQTQTEIDNAAQALKDAIDALVLAEVPLDFTELEGLIAAAELLDINHYTMATWNALVKALTAAKTTLTTATTQEEIDAAADALQAALDGLKKIPVIIVLDFTVLDELIAEAKALVETEYTAESWSKLQAALTTAESVRQTANSQFPINSAVTTLKKALAALEKVPAPVLDFTELDKQIAEAEKLTAADYTTETWTALQTALAAAKAAKSAKTQAEIDKAASDLKAAIAALERPTVVPTLDFTELDKQIAEAEKLTAADYTTETWTALQTALTAAKAAKTATTQAEIDKAANDLKAAIAALEEVPPVVVPTLDFSALDALIAQAEALNPEDYTAESWAVLQAALAEAKKAKETAVTQADIDNLAISLQAAVSELETAEEDSNIGWVIFWIVLAVVVIAAAVVVIILVLKKKNGGGMDTPGLD